MSMFFKEFNLWCEQNRKHWTVVERDNEFQYWMEIKAIADRCAREEEWQPGDKVRALQKQIKDARRGPCKKMGILK